MSNLISWKIFANDFKSMVKIPLSYKFILFFKNYIFLTCFLAFRFHIFTVTLWFFKNILSSSSSLFFPSSWSFSFLFFPHFPFVPFSFLISSFFPLSQFASFPQFGLPLPKSAAPVLPHFLLPCPTISNRWRRIALYLGRDYPFEHTKTNYIFKWMIYGSVRNFSVDSEYLTGGWPM